MSRLMTKPTKWHVRPVETQISLGIRPAWSEFSLSAWKELGSLATHWSHSEGSDQTGRMPMLIWVFAGRTGHFVGFVTRRLRYFPNFGTVWTVRRTCEMYLFWTIRVFQTVCVLSELYLFIPIRSGERGGSVVECRTPEREVRGSRPTATVLCPWARHFTPRKYWLITQEAMAPSRHDWKLVDWDVKPQHNQPTNLYGPTVYVRSGSFLSICKSCCSYLKGTGQPYSPVRLANIG